MKEYNTKFIMQKRVNWSLLNAGLSIPISVWNIFKIWDANMLNHGESRKIKILIGNNLFDAVLVNQNFDQEKHPNHKDIIQIRYSDKSPIAVCLQTIFKKSYNYLKIERAKPENARKQIPLAEYIHEDIRVFFTSNPDVLCFECNTDSEYKHVAQQLETIPEEVYESSSDDTFFMQDSGASIVEREQLVKYRRIDRSIIEKLKAYYDYRDEISGEKIGDRYGDSVVEAHHIEYFTKSQNNDTTNIIIISPNYHRIIHKNNPIFNRHKFQFEFSNGAVLKLKLYDHLKVS